MYKFPEDIKQAYESSPLSFVYYQDIDGRAVPILASEGFCCNTGVRREDVLEWLRVGMFERIHPDDVGLVARISDEFLHRCCPYDVVFRCRIAPAQTDTDADDDAQYDKIHGHGKWQTMPDGTELAVISYANLSQTQEVIRENTQAYLRSQEDRFYTDPLTGLTNINYLYEFGGEKVDTVRAQGKTPYVVYIDIYSMQSYNNQYGFEAGDRLLYLTAATLKKQFPKALITRGADDHFIMISRPDDPAELERRLHETNEIIRKTADGNTTGFRCGVCPVEAGVSLGRALDHAKHALKRIENNMNREVAFFSQAADDIFWNNRYIVENFDRAMESGWIKVYYHALYRIESQKIAAFEGLARWIDPTRGTIKPNDFVPVLLKYHQLYKLDLYMFEQVCREAKIWHENGLPQIPVSVNFSRQDFDHADIVGEMNRIYAKYGLENYVDKSYFIVEITEQDLAVGADRLREQLERIRANGYRLWLDDFGSGYSALNMFSQFEFDLVKCDMGLLRHLDDHGGTNRLILKELIYMARQLGIHTLIEGLETENHLMFVQEIGCELGQGFYYHKPESFEELLDRIKGGDLAQLCETPEERDELSRKWFQ
ncbi:MAG: EAL domain-containing protein [Clostridia bacterium]|nr:EAL domain-containing protein [Clostridia bacterium]